jgi:hypothetical protein
MLMGTASSLAFNVLIKSGFTAYRIFLHENARYPFAAPIALEPAIF